MKRKKLSPAPDNAQPFVPRGATLTRLAEAAKDCRGCELYEDATHVVFGEGSERARVVLVGEQPGDKEDLAGRPFVGPAGKLLREAMEEAGLAPGDVYLTNAVKHFYWTPQGTRRLHQKPRVSHIHACRPWLEAELARIRPEVLVCLGATAARSVWDREIAVSEERGKFQKSPYCELTLVTVHPSAVLRIPDDSAKRRAYDALVTDLRSVVDAFRVRRRAAG